MVSIKKGTKPYGTSRFSYLEHSVGKGSKVGKKTVYLGKKIPSNIDDEKHNFSGWHTMTTMMTLKLLHEIMLKKYKVYRNYL